MKCLRCQQENPEGQKFCGDCGTPLQPVGGSAQPAPSYAALQRSLTEALEQQSATSQILRVISSSPTDVQPIFEAIAESAARLCEALDVSIFRVDGDRLAFVAHQGPIAQRHGDFSLPLVRGTVGGRSMLESRTVQVADLQNEDGEFPDAVENARRFGFRTILSVPLLREGTAIGGIQLRRTEVQLFTDQKIALLQTFADQAVIAIENVRLFKELEARNRDLTVSLDRQTATADVLRIIAQSPSQLQRVLDAIAASAVRLLRARSGTLSRIVGDQIELAAHTSTDDAGDAATRAAFPQPLSFGGVHAQTIRNRAPLNIADAQTDPRLPEATHTYAQVRGYRSQGAVPMLRHDEVVGAIAVARREPGGFTDDEIALLRTFADQAVIAIENVRLFTELEARNRDLTEALTRQTATSEILRVISSSPTDVQPVFDAIARNAVTLCGGIRALVLRFDGERLHVAGHHNMSVDVVDRVGQAFPRRPGRDYPPDQALLDRSVVHVPDLQAATEFAASTAWQRGVRSLLAVPLLREQEAVGVISLARDVVGPFSPPQIEVLQTFADQAVIAIENVRLFNELESRNRDLSEALERQTATSEILQVISSFQTDIQPVFDAIAAKALELCRATTGWVYRFDGELIHIAAAHSLRPEAVQVVRESYPMPPSQGGGTARAVLRRAIVYIPDIREDHEYRLGTLAQAADYLSVLAVPMLLEKEPIGVVVVTGAEAGAFSKRQIELLQTFADQAVIAVQNARLFQEIEDKSRQIEAASRHKSEFLANMSHELRTPLNAVIGFSEVLTERMFGELNEKQDEYLKDIYASGQHLLSLINDILDLSKIEAGRMELELADFHLPQAIENALVLVRERALRRGIALEQSIDPHLGEMRGDERKVKQVLLNLLSNAIKFTPDGGRITVHAVPRDGIVEVSISDTGVGIAPEDQEAIFEEFRQVGTAAKKVEGTGLGLTLSRKFVELHGGRIWVTSGVGVGSTFTFTIPMQRGE